MKNILFLLLLSLIFVNAYALDDFDYSISRSKAAEIANNVHPSGRVVSIINQGGLYQVKIIDGGFVHIIYVNAKTGEVD